MWILILAAIILILVWFVISNYNKLVQARLKVDNQWSQIDIVLKQRSDTLPKLVKTVSAFATHEKGVLDSVTQARARYLKAGSADDKMRTSAALSAGIRDLLAVAENYPELRSNENFMSLQREISGLENKLADIRQFYNDTVMRYNRQVMLFPASLIAKMFGFQEKPFFQVDEADKQDPDVDF